MTFDTTGKLIHKTKVDFARRIVQPVVHIVQYDHKLPIVEVALFLNGEPYSVPLGVTAIIRWSKKDRTYVKQPILDYNNDRTILYFEVNEQMSYYFGDLNPVVELSIESDTASSQSIPVTIERNPIQDCDEASQTIDPTVSHSKIKSQDGTEDIKETRLFDNNITHTTPPLVPILDEENKLPFSVLDDKLYFATVLTDQNGIPVEDEDGMYIAKEVGITTEVDW